MIKNKKQLIIAIAAAVCVAGAIGAYWLNFRTVSTVGEYKITAGQLRSDINTYEDKVLTNYTEYNDEEKAALIATHKKEALTKMENEKIMETKAIELGLLESSASIDNMVEQNYAATKAGFDSDAEFQEYIKLNFYNEKSFKESIRKQILRVVLFDYLYADIQVSDEETLAYFNEHKEELTTYPYASISIATSDSKEKLEEIKSAYYETMNLKKLAEEAGDSVDYEYVGRVLLDSDTYSPEIMAALKDMSYSDVSDIFEYNGKYILLQTDEVQTETKIPVYEDYYDAMKASVQSQKEKIILEEALATWRTEVMASES